jgi:hypothetical protein
MRLLQSLYVRVDPQKAVLLFRLSAKVFASKRIKQDQTPTLPNNPKQVDLSADDCDTLCVEADDPCSVMKLVRIKLGELRQRFPGSIDRRMGRTRHTHERGNEASMRPRSIDRGKN